jgi:hypothetical protein
MISEIINAWKSSGVEKETPKFTCRYCNKSFVKESTLTSHLCEKKRRYQQEKEIAVQWGLQSYLLFYNTTQVSTKTKNYDDFVESPYYTAFVKFGRYCVDIKCVNFVSFANWLLKNNKKLDYWCSDTLYEEWLLDYLRKESVQDALERSFKEMNEYAINNPELKNGYTDYFRYGNVNRILHNISNGRISPWAIFNCKSGVEFIETLNEDQLQLILQWINPDFWNKKFKDSQEDVQWTRTVLAAAGL